MATHSSVLAWRIPGMVEPDGLLSMGAHRVGHDWSDLAVAVAWLHRSYEFEENAVEVMCVYRLIISNRTWYHHDLSPVVSTLATWLRRYLPGLSIIRLDQSLSRVRLSATPWIVARQASLSITSSRSSLRLMSIKSVMPSSHFICLFPRSLSWHHQASLIKCLIMYHGQRNLAGHNPQGHIESDMTEVT